MISPGTWKLFQRGLAPLKACMSLVKSSDVENCRMSESTAVEHLLHEEYKSKTKTKNAFELLLTTSACIILINFYYIKQKSNNSKSSTIKIQKDKKLNVFHVNIHSFSCSGPQACNVYTQLFLHLRTI